MKFLYQAEKFSEARSLLMLPHPEGEVASIASAFHECSLGLHNLNEQELDDTARGWGAKLKELMDTSGLTDPDGRGLWEVKAASLTNEEKFELSGVIVELAGWFDRHFWSNDKHGSAVEDA